jgi:hypothetical protein
LSGYRRRILIDQLMMSGLMRRIRAAAVLLGTVGALGAAFCGSVAAAAPSPTWSGVDVGLGVSSLWSDPGNWVGGVAPASDRRAATLTFPPPVFTECPDGFDNACTTSDNDLTGVSVGTLAIGESTPEPGYPYEDGEYTLTGNALRIDRLVSTDGQAEPISANLDLPIILGRDQTWHLENSSLPTSLTGRHALTIDLTGVSSVSGDTEVGRLNLLGPTGTGQPAEISFSGGESLNAQDGRPVRLDDVSVQSHLDSPDGVDLSTGPMSFSDATVGLGSESEEGNGGFTAILSTEGTRLDAGTSLVFSLGSEIVSRGPVDLGDATLKLFSAQGALESCGSVAAGTSYPIVSARGRVRGVLANALPGSLVQAGCGLYRLRYLRWPRPSAAAGVSAVLVGYPTFTTLSAPSTATTGTRVTFTAATYFHGVSGDLTDTVRFEDDGQTIPGCNAVPATLGGPGENEQAATCTTAFTTTGSHPVTAVVTPDPSTDFLPSSATATVTVSPIG